MSLSLGSGPFGRAPGAFNFDIDAAAPPHRIYFADFLPRVRAMVGGRTVLDTTRGKLLYETGIPPRFYAPLEDFDRSVLQRTDHTTHCPFKGDASYWTVGVNGSARENAVWGYESPIASAEWLTGYASLYHEQADEWWVEDERVLGRLRDPFHRVDVLRASRRVRITSGDDVIADTDRAVLLFETGLPPRAYIPRADVDAAIEPAERRTVCPYKGEARYWTVAGLADAAWSYEFPLPEATGIGGLLAFDPEVVGVEIDGAHPGGPST
jgi:uncharacterized protein (DUF427 family)